MEANLAALDTRDDLGSNDRRKDLMRDRRVQTTTSKSFWCEKGPSSGVSLHAATRTHLLSVAQQTSSQPG